MEEDLKPEDYQLFQGLASACLARGDVARLQEFLQDKTNEVSALPPPPPPLSAAKSHSFGALHCKRTQLDTQEMTHEIDSVRLP